VRRLGRRSNHLPSARAIGCLAGAGFLFVAGFVAPAVVVHVPFLWSEGFDFEIAPGEQNEVERAIAEEDVERLMMLLEAGADPGEFTVVPPIQGAAHQDAPELVQVLLDYGADVESSSEDGWTALFGAAVDGPPETVRILLEHDANPCRTTSMGDYDGMRPLDAARRRGNQPVVPLLEKATESCTHDWTIDAAR
jgi:hypothetical protein